MESDIIETETIDTVQIHKKFVYHRSDWNGSYRKGKYEETPATHLNIASISVEK